MTCKAVCFFAYMICPANCKNVFNKVHFPFLQEQIFQTSESMILQGGSKGP